MMVKLVTVAAATLGYLVSVKAENGGVTQYSSYFDTSQINYGSQFSD